MPKKCDHIEECEDCAKKIPPRPSDHVARIDQILQTMEQQQAALDIAKSNEMRYKLSIEKGVKEHRRAVENAERSLSQSKIQLHAELRKFDESLVAPAAPEAASA